MDRHNQHTPLPVEFAALDVGAKSLQAGVLRPSFAYGQANFTGYRGFNNVWGCFGSSLLAWVGLLTPGFGFGLYRTLANNALFVRGYPHALSLGAGPAYSTDPWCHAPEGHQQLRRLGLTHKRVPGVPPVKCNGSSTRVGHSTPLTCSRWQPQRPVDTFNYSLIVRTIERRCREAQTPYMLRINGQCCIASRGSVWESSKNHRLIVKNRTGLAVDYELCGCGENRVSP